MSRRSASLFAAISVVLIAGCQDSAGPGGTRPDGALHQLRWRRAPQAAQFRMTGATVATTGAPVTVQGFQSSIIAGPLPSPATLSFWAYTLQATSAEIDYLGADSAWHPYVAVTIPAGSLWKRPDGSSFGLVDSVLITMTVDSNQVLVDMEPTGLQFNPAAPATLKIWYSGADPDFNGDGVVNQLDAMIEQLWLRVWVQPDPLHPWTLVPSVQDVTEKSFTALLRHFSGYAVSW